MRPLGGAVGLLRQPSALLSEKENNKPEQRDPWLGLVVVFSLHFLNFSEFQNGDIIASRKTISNEVWLSIMPLLEHMQLQFLCVFPSLLQRDYDARVC